MAKFDFGGFATKVGLKCSDGRTIMKDAFADQDGTTVPLVWQHMHNEPGNVLGHALLENREDGVYAYCKFNNGKSGTDAKTLVEHGDIDSLSIWANSLIEKSQHVVHGVIREVSLVLAGANPGAKIDNLAFEHSDGSVVDMDDEAIIYTGLPLDKGAEKLEHSDEEDSEDEDSLEHADDGNETIGEVFDTLDDKQKAAVYAVLGQMLTESSMQQSADSQDEENLQHSNSSSEGEENIMKRNVFDGSVEEKNQPHLTHAQFAEILEDAKKMGSFKASFLAHAGTYGIDNIDFLFPDAKSVTNEPTFITRDMEWVAAVLNGVKHSPFSRIKSVHADITPDAARARGYITGNLKLEEVFQLLRRITTPQTVYKKQKLDRDDIIDITDLDVVRWLKAEMRVMLNEELARAILISDGRDPVAEADDKIDETHIRPIWLDDALYTVRKQLVKAATTTDLIDSFLEARTDYKGSGNPDLFCPPSVLTDMLLVRDTTGRRIYETVASLAAAIRVNSIVEVPLMEDLVTDEGYDLKGIVVNLRDYTAGADKGGEISFFDDFDIDYNQYKYLLEGRMSGALTLPHSALVIEQNTV